jgi:hypothetical protein
MLNVHLKLCMTGKSSNTSQKALVQTDKVTDNPLWKTKNTTLNVEQFQNDSENE